MKGKIVILTGAGMSAESGINTFRGSDGLWEGHDIMEVASPIGFEKNPKLVLDFYNARRAQLKEVEPNLAHQALTRLEKDYDVVIITQNVDDLHERAGSTKVLHLHGELRKIRSVIDPTYVISHTENIHLGDLCPKGGQLRPHIVWFGEAVPMMDEAIDQISTANYVWIIGTSMQVYPAAGLVGFAPNYSKVYYIDPSPSLNYELSKIDLRIIETTAVQAVPTLVNTFLNN